MAQTKYLTVLPTSATTVENFLRDIKKRMESCSGVPGIVYNFNSKNLVKFEDNFGAKGDLQMGIYFDYETTTPPDNYFDPEQKKMFVVSFVLIVAFHPHLNITKIVVQRSYGHSISQLTTFDYLSED